jgi:hypothetical protein
MLVICPGPYIIMPVYFIKSRGWRKGLAAIGLALGYTVLLVVMSAGAFYVSSQMFQ